MSRESWDVGQSDLLFGVFNVFLIVSRSIVVTRSLIDPLIVHKVSQSQQLDHPRWLITSRWPVRRWPLTPRWPVRRWPVRRWRGE